MIFEGRFATERRGRTPVQLIVDRVYKHIELADRVRDLLSKNPQLSTNRISHELGIAYSLARATVEYVRDGRHPATKPADEKTGTRRDVVAAYRVYAEHVAVLIDEQQLTMGAAAIALGIHRDTAARAYAYFRRAVARDAAACTW